MHQQKQRRHLISQIVHLCFHFNPAHILSNGKTSESNSVTRLSLVAKSTREWNRCPLLLSSFTYCCSSMYVLAPGRMTTWRFIGIFEGAFLKRPIFASSMYEAIWKAMSTSLMSQKDCLQWEKNNCSKNTAFMILGCLKVLPVEPSWYFVSSWLPHRYLYHFQTSVTKIHTHDRLDDMEVAKPFFVRFVTHDYIFKAKHKILYVNTRQTVLSQVHLQSQLELWLGKLGKEEILESCLDRWLVDSCWASISTLSRSTKKVLNQQLYWCWESVIWFRKRKRGE